MTAIVTSRYISDRGNRNNLGMPDYINSMLKKDSRPGIYIEETQGLKYKDCTFLFGASKIYTEGKTLLAVIKELRDLGISAFLCHKSLAMYPAELLIPYNNYTYGEVDVDKSPKSLEEMHTKSSISVPLMRESSIERDIISVSSAECEVDHSFKIDQGALYTNDLAPDSKCIFRHKAIKFILYVSNTNFIELESMLSHKNRSVSADLLFKSSSIRNTDQI